MVQVLGKVLGPLETKKHSASPCVRCLGCNLATLTLDRNVGVYIGFWVLGVPKK